MISEAIILEDHVRTIRSKTNGNPSGLSPTGNAENNGAPMRLTQRIPIDQIQLAADLLKDGGVVAFPTETVYGLGADALNAQAVEKIFIAKGRPSDNPLIAHVASLDQLQEIARDVSPLAKKLIERFWPGPLTIVVRKKMHLPNAVSAGLDTVAVRMPDEPLALELIRRVGCPIVAPSANRSGRPSATNWESVLDDLDGRIDGIVCGPPTRIGLESTVVDTTTHKPIILRHGAITMEMIAEACDVMSDCGATPEQQRRSPGTRHRHYKPQAQVVLFDHLEALEKESRPVGVLGIAEPSPADSSCDPAFEADAFEVQLREKLPTSKILICRTLSQYAECLFRFFRECDSQGIHKVYCQRVDRQGLGRAIMDRLDRAAE